MRGTFLICHSTLSLLSLRGYSTIPFCFSIRSTEFILQYGMFLSVGDNEWNVGCGMELAVFLWNEKTDGSKRTWFRGKDCI